MRSVELEVCTIEFLDQDVVHTHFKDHRSVQPDQVQAMFDVIAEDRHGRKVLLMVSVGVGTSMSNEATPRAVRVLHPLPDGARPTIRTATSPRMPSSSAISDTSSLPMCSFATTSPEDPFNCSATRQVPWPGWTPNVT